MSKVPYGISYWHDQRSRNGLFGDDLNSMLQKSIRRGLAENAVAAAYEMYITSPEYLEMLWKRLLCITVEDIGFGCPEAASLINTLNEMRREFPYADPDQPLFFVHAIRFMCHCEKERTNDHLRGWLKRGFAHGYVPEVPDYAYDMHTTKGREMGRDMIHFAQEGAKLENELDDESVRALHIKFLEFCREEGKMEGRPENEPFVSNCWQY